MTLKGKVLTVLGPREPEELGMVLPHEQPLVDFTIIGINPRPGFAKDVGDISGLDFQMKNLGLIRQFPYAVRDNLIIDNEEEVISKLKLFRQAGGGTVCDISCRAARIKRESLALVSKQSGVHIIAGSAFYVDSHMSEQERKMTLEEMRDLLVGEVMDGIGGVGGVRCGVLGEVGCSHPLTDNEIRSLQASVAAQQITGAPLMVHCGQNERSPFEIVDVLESCGADISHTVFAHIDRTLFRDEDLSKLASKGCWIEFDLFGLEVSHYQLHEDIDLPSDAQRIDKVKMLIDNGFSGRVLLSNDIHTKHRMTCYGGHRYTHIIRTVLPRLEEKGVDKSILNQITTQNPQKWLTFT